MKLKTKNVNWPRLAVQWGVIAFLLVLAFLPKLTGIATPDFEAYCPFGGLQALGSYLLNQALSCTMTSAQIVMGVLLLLGVIVFSKLFCSYICPIGTVSEWLGKLGDKLKVRFTIKGIFDKVLRSLKYILLFITLYYTLQSNELFCKKFDPYFGIASGFNNDVVLLYSILSIVAVVFGSIFIRLFWCKYICPLGAISNIFKFSIFFVAVMAIYLILLRAGVMVSYVYPLAIACAGGYVMELMGKKSRFFPVAKVTRNTNSCTDCQLCTIKCHQGIDVAAVKTVKDVDCNLCGDCLLVCPAKDTLTLNKQAKLKRLPVIATIVLVVLGITTGGIWEVPTIDMKWADAEVINEAEVYTQSGLKNIKCYGSSVAFANQMKQVSGIYGVATYMKDKRVKLYYDASILDEVKIQKLLFTPQKKPIRAITKEVETIYGVTLRLENFFDKLDFSYLSILLKQQTNAVGVLSEFDCPVVVKLFFPEEVTDTEELKDIIESEILTYETKNGPYEVELEYEIVGDPEYFTLTRNEYIASLFSPYEKSFNYREDYSDEVIKTYSIPMGKNNRQRARLSYLVSHISNDDGIVEFKTMLDETYKEVAEISYVDSLTSVEQIQNALLSDSLTITYSSGRKGRVKSMFDFTEEISQENNLE